MFKQIFLNGPRIIIITILCTVALYFSSMVVGLIVISTHKVVQTYRLHQFQKHYVANAPNIYDEGIELAAAAEEPMQCLAAVEALWKVTEEHKTDFTATRKDIYSAADAILHINCK